MSKSNNLLLNVASLSMIVCRRHLVAYSHRMSPHVFTQSQLMSGLVLKAYLKTTFCGLTDVLQASDQLRQRLGFDKVPHYSTFKKFADRVASPELINAMLGQILELVDKPMPEVAIDATGMESSTASAHYQARSGRKRHQYVKLSLAVTCTTILAVALVVSWGPTNDKTQAMELLTKTAEKVRPQWLLADAGYDAEWLHQTCRMDWGVKTLIPPAVCPRRWLRLRLLAVPNDRPATTLRQTLACRKLHERTQTDHGINPGGTIRTCPVNRSRPPCAGLRAPPLAGMERYEGLQQSIILASLVH